MMIITTDFSFSYQPSKPPAAWCQTPSHRIRSSQLGGQLGARDRLDVRLVVEELQQFCRSSEVVMETNSREQNRGRSRWSMRSALPGMSGNALLERADSIWMAAVAFRRGARIRLRAGRSMRASRAGSRVATSAADGRPYWWRGAPNRSFPGRSAAGGKRGTARSRAGRG